MTGVNDTAYWEGAADYRKIASDFTAFYSHKAWELAAVPAGARVLDIAAGTGALARIAADAGHKVLVTDFSPAMIQAVEDQHVAGVEACVMDGTALDLPDAAFDAAFSMFGIMLFDDWQAGLSEMVRVLKPGGIACVGTWGHPGGGAVNLLLWNIVSELFPDREMTESPAGMTEWCNRACFAQALERAGFTDLRFHEVTGIFTLTAELRADPERMFQFSPLWSALSDNERSAAMAAIDKGASKDGMIDIPSIATIAIGTVR